MQEKAEMLAKLQQYKEQSGNGSAGGFLTLLPALEIEQHWTSIVSAADVRPNCHLDCF